MAAVENDGKAPSIDSRVAQSSRLFSSGCRRSGTGEATSSRDDFILLDEMRRRGREGRTIATDARVKFGTG
jgi:hypothetical protein